MTQKEIIEAVKGIRPEVDHEGVDIVYSDGEYDVDVRFTSWDCLFTIELYSKADDMPLLIQSKAMTELFDYVVDLHTDYMRNSLEIEETQDYLDIYCK
jgi:predicted ATP-grasp superfamily ATP-dependent carboligase